MDQSAGPNLWLELFKIAIGGACTIVGILYGFRAAVREFRTMLADGMAKKIDVTEYRDKTKELHGLLNAANQQNAVQDNEISHLRAAMTEYKQLFYTALNKMPPAEAPPLPAPLEIPKPG